MGTMVYNLRETATQVLASKMIKENIAMDLVHKPGYGITQHEETNVTTLRMMKVLPFTDSARTLNASKNGGWFDGSNDGAIGTPKVKEYDLNLLYVYDKPVDLPSVQEDLCPVNVFEGAMKNIGQRKATEINASTLAAQLVAKYNAAGKDKAWTGHSVVIGSDGDAYAAVQSASTMLDDGDADNGIQAFPFDEREIIMRPSFRATLLSGKGVLVGGSNYAQSMLARGAVSPEARKEWGNMYCGEIDNIPCFIAPSALWNRAGDWVGTTAAFAATEAIVCAASATDRGISGQEYVKVIDSPQGVGKRLQPLTRWGINVCYEKGIVNIVKNGTAAPTVDTLEVLAPGSR